MASCCSTEGSIEQACPGCGQGGSTVGGAPVRAHVPDAPEGPWQHCATAGCPVVFHIDGHNVTEDDVRARVGGKAHHAPEPVCYCFAHTAESITADLVANEGRSTVKASIKQAVADGLCACDQLNPSGACCLGAVNRVVNAATVQASAVASSM